MDDKYTPPDGEPVFGYTLGERYSSGDMYRDMGIVPGSRVAFEKDGVIYTDTVTSINYTSGAPAIYRNLSRWQQMLRNLTPRRWRKSLLIRPADLPSVTVGCGEDTPTDRAAKTIRGIQGLIGGFVSDKPAGNDAP